MNYGFNGNPRKSYIYILITTVTITIISCIAFPSMVKGQSDKKNIFILHSYHKGFNWTDKIQLGIESVLDPAKNNIYIEYMDTYRQQEQKYIEYLKDLYAYKYKNKKFDVVICSDNAAYDFLLQYHSEIFPQTPTIFLGVNNFQQEQLGEDNAYFTGIPERPSLIKTVDIALKLHPNTKQIVSYGSDTTTYNALKKAFQKDIETYQGNVEFIFVENLTIEQALEHVKGLSKDSIILPLAVMKDQEGNLVSYEEVAEQFSKVTKLPMYGFADFYLGYGIVGGRLVGGYQQGAEAAKMALKVVNGEDVKKIPIVMEGYTNYMFDYNELQQYHIDQSQLPPHSELINEPASFYSIDKWVVRGIFGIFGVLVTLVIALETNIIARKKAQKEAQEAKNNLQESYMELEATHEELLASEEELQRQFVELQKNKEELRVSRERYKLAVAGSYDGIWDWDLSRESMLISTRGREMLGLPEDQIFFEVKELTKRITPDDRNEVERAFRQHVLKQTDFLEVECLVQVKDGAYRWVNCRGRAIWDERGKPIRIAGSISDIDEQKQSEKQIHHLAYYDGLTGLVNRILFFSKLNDILEKRKQEIIGLIFIDLDNFKTVNDSMGHSYGDQLLKDVAEMLKTNVSEGDLCARLGGDEFALLLTNMSSITEVTDRAATVLKSFNKPFVINKREFFVTVSIGIAIGPKDGDDAETLLKNADAAMYSAKGAGKNTFRLYDEVLNQHILKQIEVENNLRKALERDEFVLYYQPQVELKTGKIVGGEALIRWIHPEKGMISPFDFIPIAEQTGLIIPIGEWVLRTACKQAKQWLDEGHAIEYIAVNLSARQFQDPNLVRMIKSTLDEVGLTPEYLELEITETIAIENVDYGIQVLKELKELGVSISLDDFGTGYSSMNYLKRLPISRVKIDKSFIEDVMEEKNEREIIRAVITLAHANRLEVVAEGVETGEQLNFLRDESCDKAQGYLFSKPLPGAEILHIIKNNEKML